MNNTPPTALPGCAWTPDQQFPMGSGMAPTETRGASGLLVGGMATPPQGRPRFGPSDGGRPRRPDGRFRTPRPTTFTSSQMDGRLVILGSTPRRHKTKEIVHQRPVGPWVIRHLCTPYMGRNHGGQGFTHYSYLWLLPPQERTQICRSPDPSPSDLVRGLWPPRANDHISALGMGRIIAARLLPVAHIYVLHPRRHEEFWLVFPRLQTPSPGSRTWTKPSLGTEGLDRIRRASVCPSI